MSKKNEKLYTLPKDYTDDLLADVDEHIEVCLESIEYFINHQDSHKKEMIGLIVDFLWTNYSIKRTLWPYAIEDPTYHTDEETGEVSLMITSTVLKSLQDYVIARHLSNVELSRYSISVSMH